MASDETDSTIAAMAANDDSRNKAAEDVHREMEDGQRKRGDGKRERGDGHEEKKHNQRENKPIDGDKEDSKRKKEDIRTERDSHTEKEGSQSVEEGNRREKENIHIEKKDIPGLVDQTDSYYFKKSANPLRPTATARVAKDDRYYSMEHGRRGDCLIFVHENYDPSLRLSPRESADEDARLCKEAFHSLGFEVQILKDLNTTKFRNKLKEVSERDHSECDALVVVFMSHGDNRCNKEIIFAKDGSVETSELWEPFLGNKCTSLAGKPKLFFIQACRGQKLDHGVGMKVSTDGPSVKKREPSFVIPAHADLLIMWASFPGMFAFKSSRGDMRGSVFIHFLTEILKQYGTSDETHLADLLLMVTRKVAVEFESYCPSLTHDPSQTLDQNKQVPHTSSTLMRSIVFPALQ